MTILRNLEAIESTLERRQLRLVLAWAELHQDELRENWQRAREAPRRRRSSLPAFRKTPDTSRGCPRSTLMKQLLPGKMRWCVDAPFSHRPSR
ncbi:MAG: DUF4160 domain-containing protein [Thermoleophilaceae bacterium]